MRDPFRDLRDRGAPQHPDPAFAARLRGRLERALALPRGVVPVTEVRAPKPAAVPYLAVADGRRAIDWYVDVFGAEIVDEPIVMPDGRIGHAALTIGGGMLYLADEHPEIGVAAPRAGAASVSLMLPVDDADAVRERALAAGATGDRKPYNGYGMRNAWIVDPFGHRWGLQSPLTASTPHYRHGDVVYVSLWVPDAERAAAFYPDVVGWDVTVEGGRHRVLDATPHVGMFAGPGRADLFCCYAVDDVQAAVQRVRDAGGQAGEPGREPHGLVADCVDDQGTEFALWEIEGGGEEPAPLNGNRSGDLSYLTLLVVDSAKARAFYGAVLGWTFHAGRIEDGWEVDDVRPMVGLSGGHREAIAVPMWRVDDIQRAVAAVRASGGTATDPERQPYGTTCECTDDQGSRFYLGQL